MIKKTNKEFLLLLLRQDVINDNYTNAYTFRLINKLDILYIIAMTLIGKRQKAVNNILTRVILEIRNA